MSKENILFCIVGLLLGLIIGFMFANSVNQGAMTAAATGAGPAAAANMPAGHPAVPGANGQSGPEVQAAIENARQNPTDFEAQMKAAELYYQIQRFDSALEFLQRAHELQPEKYEVIVHLGNANFDNDKYEEAEKFYMQALTKKPDDNDVRTDLGLTFIFRSKPNYDRAVQEFERVLTAKPDHTQALQNLTVAYTKKADSSKAKATLARLEAVEPANTAIKKLREDIEKLDSGVPAAKS